MSQKNNFHLFSNLNWHFRINEKYHNNGIHNEKEIADTNRKEACLYQKIIRDNLKNATYQIEHSKRCKLVLSGYLYALRNDISHGSVISDTKKSPNHIVKKVTSIANDTRTLLNLTDPHLNFPGGL